MEALTSLIHGFGVLADPMNIVYMFVGIFLGVLIGVQNVAAVVEHELRESRHQPRAIAAADQKRGDDGRGRQREGVAGRQGDPTRQQQRGDAVMDSDHAVDHTGRLDTPEGRA